MNNLPYLGKWFFTFSLEPECQLAIVVCNKWAEWVEGIEMWAVDVNAASYSHVYLPQLDFDYGYL